MSRLVLDSNNLWMIGWTDNTVQVFEGPYPSDLNTQDVANNVVKWKSAGRIGTTRESTHQELELFGVVLGGSKVAELSKNLIDHQTIPNREGFMLMHINIGGGDVYLREGRSLMRRLNDLFDWSKYGVQVPTPVQTEWDRFQVTTGRLMVEGRGVAQAKKDLEEKEKENERLRNELAAKDKQIASLKNALQALL
ncbi:unnamed protein product [Linum tenue]|uniref:Uncharacterized protein n=1 Tax=Linum tenue TaxID=586396 RepID=A0AAV0RRY3_9ROSI|nr:unnamed protein product [Linum tenue]